MHTTENGYVVDLDAVLDAYIECALWSSHDCSEDDPDGSAMLDANYGPEDLAPQTRRAMRRDVGEFLRSAAPPDLELWARELGADQIGHDFWLTRNRHGAGFWDRFSGSAPGLVAQHLAGGRLTAEADAMGEADLYVGDDGLIYQSGDETCGDEVTSVYGYPGERACDCEDGCDHCNHGCNCLRCA